MWDYQHSIETPASAEAVWARYVDVGTWPEWNPGMEKMELDGPFQAGTRGVVTTAAQGPAAFRLVEVTDGVSFIQETRLDENVVLTSHCGLEPLAGGGTRIIHRTELNGPGSDQMAAVLSGLLINALTDGLDAFGEALRR